MIDRIKNNYVLLAGLAIAAIAPLLGLYYIRNFGFNVIYWDEWVYVPLIDKLFTGGMTLADLIAPRNEHVAIFPKILYLAEAAFFHYQTKTLCYLSWLVLTVSVIVTGKVFLDRNGGHKYAILLFLPVPFIFFTFRQWESLLFGAMSCEYLGNVGVLLALFALYLSRGADRYLALAILSGVLATFSFATGLLVWPVGLAYILLSSGKKGLMPGFYWSAAAALGLLSFYYCFRLGTKSLMPNTSRGIVGMAEYAIVSAGSFFASDVAGGLLFGAVIALVLALALYAIAKGGLVRENAFWLAYILFSAGSLAQITYGRSFLGVGNALTSRYLPFAIIGIVGLYLLTAGFFLNGPRRAYAGKAAFALLLLAVAYGIAMGYADGYRTGEIIQGGNILYGNILHDHDHMSDDQLKLLFPDVPVLKERIPIAEKYRLSVFYDGPYKP